MTAIIVSAHAALAEGLLGAVCMIAGEQELLYCVHFLPGESLTDLITRVAEQIQSSGADKALVLTDLFGASPANAASAAFHTSCTFEYTPHTITPSAATAPPPSPRA